MYLRDVLTSCLRRWPLLLICVVLSAGLVLVASTVVKPSYEASASIVLIPPPNPEEPNQNRFLGLGGLKQSADVLSGSMMSEDTAQQLGEEAPNAEYEVMPDWATSAPMLRITAKSSAPTAARDMLAAVLVHIPLNLALLQDSVGIKSSNQIIQVLVSRDTSLEPVEKTRVRLLGGLSVLLLLLSTMASAAVDGILLERRSRRRKESQSSRGALSAIANTSKAPISRSDKEDPVPDQVAPDPTGTLIPEDPVGAVRHPAGDKPPPIGKVPARGNVPPTDRRPGSRPRTTASR